ncbi:MAG: PAS domain S-box protein [Hyphomicrobiales bacterium]|nr:PAS domain S-box protein [Hyphomicrobiales bacterium]
MTEEVVQTTSGPMPAFLRDGGELGELIASFDWSGTSLGPIAGWPGHLKTSVALALRSTVPIVMLWGQDGVMIYNDGYAEFAGMRHPRSLGARVREAWPEVADFNDNIIKTVFAGKKLSYRDQQLTLERNGVAEQVYLNLDYSPVVDEEGRPVAVIVFVVETTEKVRVERQVQGERERLKQMFGQAPSFMALLSGPDHVFELANRGYQQLIGHREVVGKSVRQALPDIGGQGFYEILDRVYETGEPFVGSALTVALQRTPGGLPQQRFVDLVYQPIRDENGAVTGIFVEGIDITERIVAERAVRASEAQFRTFAEAMPNHVWTSPPSGELDWFNTRVYEYSGAAPGELDGEGWTKLVHPDDLPGAGESWAQALRSCQPYDVEFRLRRFDGAYRLHIARAVLIRDSDGSPLRWIGTNTDIEDQRQAYQRFLDSERRLRLSQDAAGIASMEVDIASGAIFGSDIFWDLFGLPKAESVHTSVVEALVLPEDRHIRSSPETRKAGTASPNVEYRIRRSDNDDIRWISRHMEFLNDAQGRPVKMFGVLRDITEQKEAQARQVLLTHELEHRIKNILATVSAIASQTLRGDNMDASRTAFNERLRALANAHDLLTRTQWTSASLESVIASAISPFPADRIAVVGPSVVLGPKRALSLALAINELGTNSLKYGALSVPAGEVSINWSRETGENGEPAIVLTWVESGGPPVSVPSRRGFGRFLIERVLAADFGGTVRIDFNAGGVECTLRAPWPTLKATSEAKSL